ncbi:hypothetical protein DMB66_17225 [Actinoplanes sp. ATCC 53533]|uniref:hypothetical protein n=1 Tax=Actinoplanes sp. ATCC 53533 TaxID=1288362 RepID=UPI000F7A90AC|nr:hypothetical protein [Actinoplanes sp. ATCC 53533]RSM65265.1 hypothetical protein DMB66_17225 [Actinoplanes sp. ATCC 53533]
MGQRTYVGVDKGKGRYHAVYHQNGLYVHDLLPELRRDWQDIYHGDTAAMAAAMVDPRRVHRSYLHRGRITEAPSLDMEQLTLLEPDHDGVSVYVPHQNKPWAPVWSLHSRHRLTVTDTDLFVVAGNDEQIGTWTCTRCGAVDQLAFTTRHRRGNEPGPNGELGIVTCTACRSAETTDSLFKVTVDHTP